MSQLMLKHVKGNTYYIPSPANMGLYVEDGNAVLIDSGNDSEAGRQILKVINGEGWKLKMIVNTHSNADHTGGNSFLQERTGCRIAATNIESAFINNPLLEPSFLYGGFPFAGLRNKFLMAKPSTVTDIVPSSGDIADTMLRAVPLPGHFFDMIGVMTPDNIYFIGDSLFPENIINKYHLFYILDIKSYLETIDKLKNVEAELFIPSHGEPFEHGDALIELNRKKVYEIIERIQYICKEPVTAEEVLQKVCSLYDIPLNANQYVLIFSTIRAYLSYLLEEGLLERTFDDFKMTWKAKKTFDGSN